MIRRGGVDVVVVEVLLESGGRERRAVLVKRGRAASATAVVGRRRRPVGASRVGQAIIGEAFCDRNNTCWTRYN